MTTEKSFPRTDQERPVRDPEIDCVTCFKRESVRVPDAVPETGTVACSERETVLFPETLPETGAVADFRIPADSCGETDGTAWMTCAASRDIERSADTWA